MEIDVDETSNIEPTHSDQALPANNKMIAKAEEQQGLPCRPAGEDMTGRTKKASAYISDENPANRLSTEGELIVSDGEIVKFPSLKHFKEQDGKK